VLVASFKVKKPSDEQLMATLFANGVAALQQAGKLADNRSKAFNHQSAFTEFLNCIQWVMIAPAPKPFVLSCRDSADFYLNKILTTFKDDPLKEHHRNFVKFLKSTIENLGEYIKQFFTTGLTWNASVRFLIR
jgi:adenylyl cyclase-associated protein